MNISKLFQPHHCSFILRTFEIPKGYPIAATRVLHIGLGGYENLKNYYGSLSFL